MACAPAALSAAARLLSVQLGLQLPRVVAVRLQPRVLFRRRRRRRVCATWRHVGHLRVADGDAVAARRARSRLRHLPSRNLPYQHIAHDVVTGKQLLFLDSLGRMNLRDFVLHARLSDVPPCSSKS